MKSFMIDSETTGTADDAAVVQPAIVVFDDETFKIHAEFCVNIELMSLLLAGFTTCPNTMKNFWGKQSRSVRDTVFSTGREVPVRVAAQMINDFMAMHVEEGEKCRLYCDHLLFDVPKFNLMQTTFGYKPFAKWFPHYMIEDSATVRNTAKMLYPDEFAKMKEGVDTSMKHNALFDCYQQIKTLQSSYSLLGSAKLAAALEPKPVETVKPGGTTPVPQTTSANKRPVDIYTPDLDPLLHPPLMEDTLPQWEDDDSINCAELDFPQ